MSFARLVLSCIAVVAAMAAVTVNARISRLRRRAGFATTRGVACEIVSSDTGIAPRVVLRDPVLGLRGVPDYLLEESAGGMRRLVPVEVKPKRRSPRLYDSDRMQIGAYLIALRGTAGDSAARFGYVRYAERSFRVPLSSNLELEVHRTVASIRAGRSLSALPRSHNSAARCRACAVRHHCDASLAR
ncbi:MAG: CRISPR-associated protein Cas4 [Gemmatimonadaceae bacterium]